MDSSKIVKKRIEDLFGSVNKFSKEIGISQSTLASALSKPNGVRAMNGNNVIKICKVLGLDMNVLFDNEQEPLSVPESKLINLYRKLSNRSKDLVMTVTEALTEIETPQTISGDYEGAHYLAAASGSEGMSDEQLELLQQDIEDIKKLNKINDEIRKSTE